MIAVKPAKPELVQIENEIHGVPKGTDDLNLLWSSVARRIFFCLSIKIPSFVRLRPIFAGVDACEMPVSLIRRQSHSMYDDGPWGISLRYFGLHT